MQLDPQAIAQFKTLLNAQGQVEFTTEEAVGAGKVLAAILSPYVLAVEAGADNDQAAAAMIAAFVGSNAEYAEVLAESPEAFVGGALSVVQALTQLVTPMLAQMLVQAQVKALFEKLGIALG
jgi:hypothetical protein